MGFVFLCFVLQSGMTKILKALTLVSTFILALNLAPAPVQAAVTPLSFGIVPPIQFPSSEYSITGLRISALWGEHRDIYGLDFGVIGNITTQTFVGTAISGLFNITRNSTTIVGLQLAGAANINSNKTNVYGAQIALGVNSNTAAASVSGLQIAGLANLSEHTDIYGAQIGLYNRALDVYGLQIGLVNVAQSLHGIQIGLLNFNQKGLFFVAPILNIGF
jgi:hypothetical protein